MSRNARVLSMGWFGEGNLGDEAMLEGLLILLERALGPTEVTVATSAPDETARRFGTAVIRRTSPAASGFRDLALVRSSWRADLVTLGGGDLIREQADGTVPAINWLSRLRVPLRLRRPTALIGVSVGELYSPQVVETVSRYLRRVTLIAARDSASAARLAELLGGPVLRIGDLALEAIEPLGPTVRRDGPPRIGVATRDIIGRGPSVPGSATTDLRAELAAALDRIVAESGARIELLPFRTRGPRPRSDDDRAAGVALASLARSGADWIHHGPLAGAAGFAAAVDGLDLILSVRLHGAVLGAAAGRRVVGLAYDPKVSGFLEDLGVPMQALPLASSAEAIVERVLTSLGDDTLESRIRHGVAAARAETRRLEPILRRVVRGDNS